MTRKTRLEELLTRAFDPARLEVEDESHMHASGRGRESHFRVVIVSPTFEGVSRVDRHRRVNGAVRDVFDDGLHALSIHAMTDPEYRARGEALASPPCAGGDAKPARGPR